MKAKKNELWPIINILNEVCHGVPVNDFNIEVGCEYNEICFLITKFSDNDKKFCINDWIIINNCFEKVLKEIDEWEFATRIGVSIKETQKLINSLYNIIESSSCNSVKKWKQ